MPTDIESRFVERLRELLVTLPYDLKVLFAAMADEDLSTEVRQLAAGGVIYCLAPSDPIPDSSGIVGFVDDVIVVRTILKQILERGKADAEEYPKRFPEQFEQLDADLKLFSDYLGDALRWVNQRVDKLAEKSRYKGKSVVNYIDEEEAGQFLYEEGLEFTTNYEIDDEKAYRLTSGKPVLDAFKKRTAVESARP